MNQSKKINFWYKDHVVVKVWEGNSQAYVHFNKLTKSGTKSLTFCGDAIRALLNNKEEIVSAIDAVEREFQEEREMLALAAPDELEETQLIQRAPLNTSRWFQPYGAGGNFQEEQEQGVPINKVALGLGQGRGGAPSNNNLLGQG
ncbi:uncharacterized protein LOC121376892 [Gigantopelta aegis]|uniref:uncharacterized protein LOC121376892 n=1 Tax=Gigantopelta aegis TaxID=1735272 RepID=UPI001B88BD64|nr:uncharacterized protein LOC121376892 [Gigantopelta aegis]